MELPVEHALQRAVTAHKEGKLQDAERLYRAILQTQPTNSSANHNLGVIAVSENKTDEALPLFKAALEANPKIEQFWLSYIDALIREKQFANAKKILELAKKQGVDDERLNSVKAQLSSKLKKLKAAGISPPKEQLNSLLELYQSGRFNDAKELAVSITTEFPQQQFAWNLLGASLNQLGKTSDSVVAFEKAVKLVPHDAASHSNLGSALKELGRFDEAEASFTQAIALKPDLAEAHYNLGITLKELGRLDEALISYNQAIVFKPGHAGVHNNLGNTLKALGRLDEALASYNQAIALKPDYAEAHYSLGITLQELGKLDEAVDSYNQAKALKPDLAEAHYNLGNTLRELGRLDEALASYNQAIALKPDYAEAHNNLGIMLKDLRRLDEALANYYRAIELKPDYAEAYVNLGIAIKSLRFNLSKPELYTTLTQLLNGGNFTRPQNVAGSILSLLRHDNLLKDFLLKKNFDFSPNELTSIIGNLDRLPLLHHLMRLCPLPELQFEKLFIAMRSTVLGNLDKMEASTELIYFLSTLSIHCFTNEYVYIEREEEAQLVGELQAKISQTLAQSEQPEVKDILCLASYRPLYQFDWCQKLESLDHLVEVKKRLIEEPFLEKKIAEDIPVLNEISDEVSLKVKEQYEENPYPRWVKTGVPTKAKPIVEVFDELMLQPLAEIKNVTAPAILIAGCGTGQHSIETASRFSNCHVTAVDLSLASLAYARRKSEELCLSNIDYLQADILHLDLVGKEFDIIESVGVLHHMYEPMAGWRVLVDLLKPGGLMKIGLYSELARQHIIEVQKEVRAQQLVGTSENEIKYFRQSLTESHDENHQRLAESGDFFSLSTVRDLIFHVQEHRFTLPQIKNCLDELGLKFCGFENKDLISSFRELHRDEEDIFDLELWHQYEEKHPHAFARMYQFWCQKTPS